MVIGGLRSQQNPGWIGDPGPKVPVIFKLHNSSLGKPLHTVSTTQGEFWVAVCLLGGEVFPLLTCIDNLKLLLVS